jgi:hypothetical protein
MEEAEPTAVGGKRLKVGGEDREQHPQTSSEAILKPNAAESVTPQTSSKAILKPNAAESVTPQTSSGALLQPNAASGQVP